MQYSSNRFATCSTASHGNPHAFVSDQTALVLVLDETLERRRGQRIKYKGIFREGVLSTAKHVVKSMG